MFKKVLNNEMQNAKMQVNVMWHNFRVRCMVCGAILKPKRYGEFIMCECPNQSYFYSGTDFYYRMGGIDPTKIEVEMKWPEYPNVMEWPF